jgi:ABC-type amino acid transport substrate-binding protein/signal transduction histidine kinase/DNA-directed RNA polymerase subunit L
MLKKIYISIILIVANTFALNAAISLTPEEQAYIQKVGSVKMCVDPDWIPFERINEKGEHEGIAADLIALVSQRTGLKIELYKVKTWDESVEASKKGKCQMMSFLNQTPARDKWLIFTEPIFYDPNVFVTREEHSFIADPKSLSNESIALPRNTMVAERIKKEYPNLKIIGTTSEEEAVSLVSDRKADMTMRSLIVAAYAIKKEGLFNLKIAGQLPDYSNKLRIGVLKDEPILRSILDKGVSTLTLQEREQISNKHVSIRVQKGVDYALVWKVVAGAFVVILAAIYWNRRLARFNAKISALQKETKEALYQVETLLNNSTEGFLSFGENLIINKEYSKECETMFGHPIDGAPIAHLLYKDDADSAELLKKNLERIFDSEDDFKTQILISLLPRVYNMDTSTLSAKYKKLDNKNMMLVLDDISAELALKEQVLEEQMRLRFVVTVFKEKEDIQNLIKEFKLFLQDNTVSGDELYRQLHTFKGTFSQFNFYHTTKALHEAEERKSKTKELQAALDKDMATLHDILGYDIFGMGEKISVDLEALELLEQSIGTFSPDELKLRLKELRYRPFRELLGSYPKFCTALANRMDKEIEEFCIEGGKFLVDAHAYAGFVRALVHIFRNIIAHGIESPEERARDGKSEAGKIKCEVSLSDKKIALSIHDNGRGIDTKKLIQRASELNIDVPTNPLMLIFENSLSTNKNASELSGRGFGLSALKEEVEKLGGSIEVQTKIGYGTTFICTIPLI